MAAKDWLQRSMVLNVVINGPTGTLRPGGLRSSSDFRSTMVSRMSKSGVPMDVAAAFSDSLAQAWNAWFEGYQVQLSYPTFAAVPGPMAPVTPCLPQPVKAGASLNAHRLTPALLQTEITTKLGKAGTDRSASQAANEFAKWFSDRFSAWQSVATLVNVLGKGPVPSFAPPYVPVGAVIGGDSLRTPSTPPLSDYGVFDAGL
ncbi:MAG: hypothetical protein ACRD2I_06805 [Vicinamibacterales bacterium]